MLDQLIRPEIVNLDAYEWEISNPKLAELMGLEPSQIKRFDTNTSPYRLQTIMKELAQEFPAMPINEYPDTSYADLTQLTAEYTRTDEQMIVITAGADEGLDIVAKTFLGIKNEAILPVPTYSMFRVVTEIAGATARDVVRKSDFSVDLEEVLGNINDKTRVIFLCNPNNPTGNPTPRNDIEQLLENTNALVFIDEAYSEFYGKSVVDLTYDYENLVVLRTLSKAFGMAAMRVAFLVANQKTVQALHKVRPPNSLCVFSVRMAEVALTRLNAVKDLVQSILKERTRFRAELDQLEGITTFPSEANFLLVRFHNIPVVKVHQELLKKGLVTRDISSLPLLQNCLRITVRSKEDDDFFLESLKEVLSIK